MASIDLLRAVHHPTRRRLLDYLYVNGASQVGTLAAHLDQHVGSISHHLRMLERAGVVERAPELATDGRTSWWRAVTTTISWAVDDFADQPAQMMEARTAQRLTYEHQFRRLAEWQKRSDGAGKKWRGAAFSADGLSRATSTELEELSRLFAEAFDAWAASIDRDDGQEREPVFWFVHGFPVQP